MNNYTHNSISFSRQILSGVKRVKSLNLSSLRKVFSLMGKKEKTLFLTLLLIAVVSLAWTARNLYYSATVPAPSNGGELTEGFVGQPSYINPALAYQNNDITLIRLVYSGLYKYNGQGNLVPDLAEDFPQISEDQKQYTINLKKNVQWHNGRPFTANDVVFTFDIIKDPNFKSPLKNTWASTNVEKIDEFSVKFTTKEVAGPFLNNLTQGILPQNIWGNTTAQTFALSENNLKAIGTGPYAVSQIKKLNSGKVQSITLESFSNYFAGKPKLDLITVKFYDASQDLVNALHSGEISSFGFVPFDEDIFVDPTRQNAQILKVPLPQFQAIFFNFQNKDLKERNVRAALSMLVSRQTIVEKAFGGNAKAAACLFCFYSGGSADIPAVDPAAATELLEASGYKKSENGNWSKNGHELELRLFTSDFLPNARAAEELAQEFRNFGIKINLNILPAKQLSDSVVKTRDFDILLLGQKFGSDPDPFGFWHSSQTNDPGLNLSGFADAEADKLITAARTTTDQAARLEKYDQLDALLKDRVPVVFLTQTVYTYFLDDSVKGVNISKLYDSAGRFYDTPNWYVMEGRVFK